MKMNRMVPILSISKFVMMMMMMRYLNAFKPTPFSFQRTVSTSLRALTNGENIDVVVTRREPRTHDYNSPFVGVVDMQNKYV
jgi:hypothetical protein